MLDPTARTLDGIQALIQREWIIAGHPFLDRLGHLLQPKRKKTKSEEGEASKMVHSCCIGFKKAIMSQAMETYVKSWCIGPQFDYR